MALDLPFEPVTAFDSLQRHLPPFVVNLAWADIKAYLLDGFVARRFLLHGRFRKFGHTVIIRSADELTVKSLLDSRIPKNDAEPRYNGDAVGCKLSDTLHSHMELKSLFHTVLIKGEAGIFTRSHNLCLTEIPNGKELVFVYRRPSLWQALDIGRDMFYDIQYDEDFELSSPSVADINYQDENGILRFFSNKETMNALVEAFKEGVQRKSRFGFTLESLRAMQGLSLTHRVLKQYAEAESILAKALALAHSATATDMVFRLQISYEFGELYLDQGKLNQAERKFLFVEKAIRQHQTPHATILQLQVAGALADVALHRQRPRQAESILRSALQSPSGPSCAEKLENIALRNKMSITYCAQDRLVEARAICEKALSEQEECIPENHYHRLRTTQCLAKVLYEQGQSAESKALYQRLYEHIHAILGLDHPDTLRTIESLAQIYYDEYDLEESLSLRQQLCKKYKIELGESHPTTWEAIYQLAQSLRDTGKESLAVDVLEHILPQTESVNGSYHYSSRQIMFVLEDLYRHLGNTSLAGGLRRKLVSLNDNMPGKGSSTKRSCSNNIRTC